MNPSALPVPRWIRCLLLFFCLTAGILRAADPTSGFEQANKLYEQGQFAAATAAYEQLAKSGPVSTALFFNWGNALFKSGQTGRALVCYLQAEARSPRDPDVTANLKFARDSVGDNASVSRTRWQRALGKLTLNEWTVLTMVLVWLWLGLLAVGHLRPDWRANLRRAVWIGGIFAAVLAGCTAVAARDRLGVSQAVVVAPEAVVRHGPLPESLGFYTLRNGAEVRVADRQKNWVQVQDARHRLGWMARDQVILLRNGQLRD
jgi:tetratricopeptide (TPR) repeat protein